jgi:hypothetical protein
MERLGEAKSWVLQPDLGDQHHNTGGKNDDADGPPVQNLPCRRLANADASLRQMACKELREFAQ